MRKHLVLNIAPVHFEDAEITVGVSKYEGKDQLAELREKNNLTHLFRRTHKNEIRSVSLDGKPSSLGDKTETIRLSENLSLCAALIQNSVINHFHGMSCEILDFKPIQIITRSTKENFLATVVSNGVTCPDWLSVRPLCEIDVRVIDAAKGKAFIGIALNIRCRRRVLSDCEQLLREGLSLSGLYVRKDLPSKDPRVAPLTKLLGRIANVDGSSLILDHTMSDTAKVEAREVKLKCDHEALLRCLRHLFGSDAERIATALDRAVASTQTGPMRLKKLDAILNYLRNQKLQFLPGITAEIGYFLDQAAETFPAVYEAPAPTYVFDPAGKRTDTSKPRGLDIFGPYTVQTFTPTRPRICVVCQSGRKGDVEQFLHKFLNGISPGTGKFPPFKKGLIRGYGLENASTDFFTSDGPTALSYKRASQAALEFQGEKNIRWDLAMVQTDACSHELHADQNPYLITKAAFLSQQIPVQEFEAETMSYRGGQLEYSLSNMALATYAKLGGVPWLLKADPTIAHELVVGLGSCFVSRDDTAERERVVGITTMFSGDGNYFLSNLSRAVPAAEFKAALLDALKASFEKAKSQMNWQKGDHVRLVFHSFKPMKDMEADAVKELAASLDEYSVEFAFLHLAHDHPYLLFDTEQEGVQDYETRSIKGEHAPIRGLYCRLSKRDVLLSVTGPKEVKRPSDGMPYPLLLKLHDSSTFHDTSYLAKQVFAFSSHSWRSFLPSSFPVTISYSQLIANMLGNLALLPKWNPDSMLGKLGRSRWFL